MKIAVCMKQVPAYSDGNMNEKTGLIIRKGLPSITNIYDLSALETALQMKEKVGAIVTVFTMGPINSEQVIREAYACGADEGFLISDKAFSGADVLSTSYTLMQAINCTGIYDLILCGKQTTDGDTAQVGGALAKWLGIPHITGVTKLVNVQESSIIIQSTSESKLITEEIGYPCLFAVERTIFVPRMPSLKLKIAGKKKEVPIISLENMRDKEAEHYGQNGSATRVQKIFPPERTKRQKVTTMNGKEAAKYLNIILKQLDCIKEES